MNLCSAYRQKGQIEKALAVLGKTKELDPKNLAVHSQLGAVYLDFRKFDDAVKEYQTAIEIDPADADALAQDGKIQNALPYFRQPLASNPSSPLGEKKSRIRLFAREELACSDCRTFYAREPATWRIPV